MATSEHCPVLIVIAGPNGSGKTSITSKILHHDWLEDSEYINPDNVARDIFGDWRRIGKAICHRHPLVGIADIVWYQRSR